MNIEKIIFLLVYWFQIPILYAQINHLENFFHHEGCFGDTLVCYFSADPEVKSAYISAKNEHPHIQSKTFFLPMTDIRLKQSKDINAIKKLGYSISFQEVKTPKKGLQITLFYDPEKIICDYALSKSITMKASLVFSFHFRHVLDAIKEKTENILRYAFCEKKNQMSPKIIIDSGHGGPESGAVSSSFLKEKDITMSVGTKLADLLQKRGFEVSLTRCADIGLSLEERTKIANGKKADLFISIHANAGDASACGVETYWFSRNSLKPISCSDISLYGDVLQARRKRLDYSSRLLAQSVHTNILHELQKKYTVQDRSIKDSMAQVLIGCDMPSALVEIGFMSNKEEVVRLSDPGYQELIARGITKGIEMYCKAL